MDEHDTGADPPDLLQSGRLAVRIDRNAAVVCLAEGPGRRAGWDGLGDTVGRDNQLVVSGQTVDQVRGKGLIGVEEKQVSRVAILRRLHEIESVLWQNTGPYIRELKGLPGVVSYAGSVELIEQVDKVHTELSNPVRPAWDTDEAGKVWHISLMNSKSSVDL